MFVDDLRENVAGAEAVGMTAVLHRDSAETIARLEELLGVQPRLVARADLVVAPVERAGEPGAG